MARQHLVRIKLEDGRDLLVKLRTPYLTTTCRIGMFVLGGAALVWSSVLYRYGYTGDAIYGAVLGFGICLLAKG